MSQTEIRTMQDAQIKQAESYTCGATCLYNHWELLQEFYCFHQHLIGSCNLASKLFNSDDQKHCIPRVLVLVSFGGTNPRLRAIALDILGAVVPGPAPTPSSSPSSEEGPLAPPEEAARLPTDPHAVC